MLQENICPVDRNNLQQTIPFLCFTIIYSQFKNKVDSIFTLIYDAINECISSHPHHIHYSQDDHYWNYTSHVLLERQSASSHPLLFGGGGGFSENVEYASWVLQMCRFWKAVVAAPLAKNIIIETSHQLNGKKILKYPSNAIRIESGVRF